MEVEHAFTADLTIICLLCLTIITIIIIKTTNLTIITMSEFDHNNNIIIHNKHDFANWRAPVKKGIKTLSYFSKIMCTNFRIKYLPYVQLSRKCCNTVDIFPDNYWIRDKYIFAQNGTIISREITKLLTFLITGALQFCQLWSAILVIVYNRDMYIILCCRVVELS